jgi:hypothetical protein
MATARTRPGRSASAPSGRSAGGEGHEKKLAELEQRVHPRLPHSPWGSQLGLEADLCPQRHSDLLARHQRRTNASHPQARLRSVFQSLGSRCAPSGSTHPPSSSAPRADGELRFAVASASALQRLERLAASTTPTSRSDFTSMPDPSSDPGWETRRTSRRIPSCVTSSCRADGACIRATNGRARGGGPVCHAPGTLSDHVARPKPRAPTQRSGWG